MKYKHELHSNALKPIVALGMNDGIICIIGISEYLTVKSFVVHAQTDMYLVKTMLILQITL